MKTTCGLWALATLLLLPPLDAEGCYEDLRKDLASTVSATTDVLPPARTPPADVSFSVADRRQGRQGEAPSSSLTRVLLGFL